MNLYWKTSQPVPGKGQAWVHYECDEKFNILRHLTHFPATGDIDCVKNPVVKRMTDMYLMDKGTEEEFMGLWVDSPESDEPAVPQGDSPFRVFNLDMTVAEAMSLHPRVSDIFAAFRLGGCGSCGIGEVETVRQVCQAYGVDAELLQEVVDDLLNPKEAQEA